MPDPRKTEELAAGKDRSLSLTNIDEGPWADAAVPEMRPSGGQGRKVWAEAGAVFVFVTGLGIAEVQFMGRSGWLAVVFVALVNVSFVFGMAVGGRARGARPGGRGRLRGRERCERVRGRERCERVRGRERCERVRGGRHA
ncbi:MAG: hypothetical protein M3P44_04055, partial [Actinomycetota bacterium]|nr:hypothetical protein [Actinomycetota bacterium]